jgi:ketosteroid isomerase-like protein
MASRWRNSGIAIADPAAAQRFAHHFCEIRYWLKEETMKIPTLTRTAVPLVFALAFVLASDSAGAAQAGFGTSDEQQLRTLQSEYMQAVDKLDFALVDAIWSHDPGVSFIHPRGTAIGFEQIRDGFYRDTMGLFAQRDLTLENPVLHIYGDCAWSEMTWTFHATMKNGQKITTTGRETQIYHRENGSWRIVHVHYSGPPITGALRGF